MLCSFDFVRIYVCAICGLYVCLCLFANHYFLKNMFDLFLIGEFVLRCLVLVCCDVLLFGLFVSFERCVLCVVEFVDFMRFMMSLRFLKLFFCCILY